MPGYIYLIMMADGVYKVGRTFQEFGTHIKRLKSYPADSQIVYVRRTNGDAVVIEREIIKAFQTEFGIHPRGREFFTGNDTRMVQIIDAFLVCQYKREFKPLEHFMVSDHIKYGPEFFCPQQVFVSRFFQYCKDTGFQKVPFTPDMYSDLFEERGIEVRHEEKIHNDRFYPPQTIFFGVDFVDDPYP